METLKTGASAELCQGSRLGMEFNIKVKVVSGDLV